MKLKYFAALFLTVLFLQPLAAHAQNLGFGFMIGDPTALSFKYGRDTKNSIDAALWFENDVDFGLHGDYLWNHRSLFSIEGQRFDGYYGVGLRIRDREDRNPPPSDPDDDKMQIGARFPGGLRWLGRSHPIEIFLEAALVFNVVPSTDADVDVSLGARFYF